VYSHDGGDLSLFLKLPSVISRNESLAYVAMAVFTRLAAWLRQPTPDLNFHEVRMRCADVLSATHISIIGMQA
jgi:hypothetical protein